MKEPPFFAKVQPAADHTKFKDVPIVTFSSKNTEKPSLLSPRMNSHGINLSKQHQKSRFWTSVEPHTKMLKQFESIEPHTKILTQFESTGRPTFYKSHEPEMGPSTPVQLMRVLAEKGQNQQMFFNQSSQLLSSAPSSFINDSNLAALHAPRTWMPVGPGKFRPDERNTKQLNNQICFDSLIQPRDFPSSEGIHVQPERFTVGSEIQFHNQPTFYPPLTTADMLRFPIQPTWWNLRPNLDSDYQSPDPALQLRQFI